MDGHRIEKLRASAASAARRRRWPPGAWGLALAALAAACAPPPPAPRELLWDATEASGLDFVHFNGMSGELYFCEMVGAGAALFDYDGDGDLDAFFVQGSMLGRGKTVADALVPPRHDPPFADHLWRNDGPPLDGDGVPRFTRMPGATPERHDGYGMGVAAGDYDNDGDLDLYVTSLGANHLLRNQGDGTFRDVTAESGTDDPRWSSSAAFADLDADGWLDLFVVNYVAYVPGHGKPCFTPTGVPDYCGPQGYEGETSRLFANRRDGSFADVTLESGVAAAGGSGLGIVTADLDGDGRLDAYVANDLMANRLWQSKEGEGFQDVGLEAGAALNIDGIAESSMGVDAADLDGDGDDELFMTHIDEQTNTLYVNQGGGLFLDSTAVSGLGPPSLGYTGFGTALADFDLDGDLDILVANGAVVRKGPSSGPSDPLGMGQEDQLFLNEGRARFAELLPRPAALTPRDVGRGTGVGDVDNDGDPDVLVTNNNGPARLLLGEPPAQGHWLSLRLRAAGGPEGLPGTRARLDLPGGSLHRRARTDGSYLSANDGRVHFASGSEARYQRLEVAWPDGRRSVFLGPPSDRQLVLEHRVAR